MWNQSWQSWNMHQGQIQSMPHDQVDWAELAKQWIAQRQDGGGGMPDTSVPPPVISAAPPPPPPLPPADAIMGQMLPVAAAPSVPQVEHVSAQPNDMDISDDEKESQDSNFSQEMEKGGERLGGPGGVGDQSWQGGGPGWWPGVRDPTLQQGWPGDQQHMMPNKPFEFGPGGGAGFANNFEYGHLDQQPFFCQEDQENFGPFWGNEGAPAGPSDAMHPPPHARFMHNDRRPHMPMAAMPPTPEDSGLDAVKRRQLPAWIREGLEKMEREKQKKLEKEQREKERLEQLQKKEAEEEKERAEEEESDEPLVPRRSKFDSDEEEDMGMEDKDSKKVEQKEATPPHKRSRFRSRTPSPKRSPPAALIHRTPSPEDYKTEEEKQMELMLKIKRWLTEILLEVTSEQIESVAQEVYHSARSVAAKAPAKQLAKSSGLASIRSIGLGYGSTSESESGSEEEEAAREGSRSSMLLVGISHHQPGPSPRKQPAHSPEDRETERKSDVVRKIKSEKYSMFVKGHDGGSSEADEKEDKPVLKRKVGELDSELKGQKYSDTDRTGSRGKGRDDLDETKRDEVKDKDEGRRGEREEVKDKDEGRREERERTKAALQGKTSQKTSESSSEDSSSDSDSSSESDSSVQSSAPSESGKKARKADTKLGRRHEGSHNRDSCKTQRKNRGSDDLDRGKDRRKERGHDSESSQKRDRNKHRENEKGKERGDDWERDRRTDTGRSSSRARDRDRRRDWNRSRSQDRDDERERQRDRDKWRDRDQSGNRDRERHREHNRQRDRSESVDPDDQNSDFSSDSRDHLRTKDRYWERTPGNDRRGHYRADSLDRSRDRSPSRDRYRDRSGSRDRRDQDDYDDDYDRHKRRRYTDRSSESTRKRRRSDVGKSTKSRSQEKSLSNSSKSKTKKKKHSRSPSSDSDGDAHRSSRDIWEHSSSKRSCKEQHRDWDGSRGGKKTSRRHKSSTRSRSPSPRKR